MNNRLVCATFGAALLGSAATATFAPVIMIKKQTKIEYSPQFIEHNSQNPSKVTVFNPNAKYINGFSLDLDNQTHDFFNKKYNGLTYYVITGKVPAASPSDITKLPSQHKLIMSFTTKSGFAFCVSNKFKNGEWYSIIIKDNDKKVGLTGNPASEYYSIQMGELGGTKKKIEDR